MTSPCLKTLGTITPTASASLPVHLSMSCEQCCAGPRNSDLEIMHPHVWDEGGWVSHTGAKRLRVYGLGTKGIDLASLATANPSTRTTDS